MTVRNLNLVVPLVHKATDKRITDTTDSSRVRSGAVSQLIDANLRQGDVDSTTRHSTPPTRTLRGARTSVTATRTTTTRTTGSVPVPSADQDACHYADFYFGELVSAYFDCRKGKRNSASAAAFEIGLENNLRNLYDELNSGTYMPGRSICFVITRPKPREVWAAEFRDRIVHHLLYNRIAPRFHASFIADSCACIPGRGTLYAAKRLESKVRSITQSWSKPAHYLKCDIANFFVSIDKDILFQLIAKKVNEPWWLNLAGLILFHDPRENYEMHGSTEMLKLVPPHKRLTNHPASKGLPIGNLSSQLFANIYMNALDQYTKHQIGVKHYIRYVDDFVLLHESPQWLNDAKEKIETFLSSKLSIILNPTKTVLQPIDRGIDFVGQVIKPWRCTTRKRTRNDALNRIRTIDESRLFKTANSYFGLFRQASHSHHDRARLGKILQQRGHSIKGDLTKTYRGRTPVKQQLNQRPG